MTGGGFHKYPARIRLISNKLKLHENKKFVILQLTSVAHCLQKIITVSLFIFPFSTALKIYTSDSCFLR